MKHEALDRIHVICTMMSSILVSDSEDLQEGYHSGLSPGAKELVGKAMECLCDAYQKQGVFAFEETEQEKNSRLLKQELQKLNIERPLKNEIERLKETINICSGRASEAENEYNRIRTKMEYPICTGERR